MYVNWWYKTSKTGRYSALTNVACRMNILNSMYMHEYVASAWKHEYIESYVWEGLLTGIDLEAMYGCDRSEQI
jgi:hypothetical protein